NSADSACGAWPGAGEIDRHPSSLLSAALSQATDGVGERAQDPALSRRTGLDAGEGGRTNGQEWHQDRGAVARIHDRCVVRRWRGSGEEDGEVVPRLCGRDAEGLSGALRDLRAALDDGYRCHAQGGRAGIRRHQGGWHQPADQLRRQMAGPSGVQARARGTQPTQGGRLCASPGRSLLQPAERRHLPGGDRGAARHDSHRHEPASERVVRALPRHQVAILPRRRNNSDDGGPYRRLLRKAANLKEFAPDGIVGELKRLHYDTANATSAPAMAALTKLVPISQITYGSDYPYFPLDQITN